VVVANLLIFRWTFLEKGINSVMLNLDQGVDMKTVCSKSFLILSEHVMLTETLFSTVHGLIHVRYLVLLPSYPSVD